MFEITYERNREEDRQFQKMLEIDEIYRYFKNMGKAKVTKEIFRLEMEELAQSMKEDDEIYLQNRK